MSLFHRSFRRFFNSRKTAPIRKATKIENKARLQCEQLEDRLVPANFTTGDLAVLQFASTSTNTTGTVLGLNPTNGTVDTTVTIAATGASALRFSDSGTSGFLSDSSDGTQLVMAAYNTTDSTTADLATTGTSLTTGTDPDDRAVATLANNTNLTIQTNYVEPTSGDQTRAATTVDNSTYAIADKGGLFSNGEAANTLSPAVNILVTRAFGGTLYVASTGASSAVSTISSPTATSLTGLPTSSGTLAADGAIQDFYMIQSGQHGSTYDILYTIDQGSGDNINKYSLVSGDWVSNGSVAFSLNDTAMAVANDGDNGAYLYVVTTKQTLGNAVERLTDTGGWNQALTTSTLNTSTTGSNPAVVLYTTTATTTLKGIAFAPVAAGSAAPQITSANSTNVFYQNAASTFQVVATGSPAPTYSLSGAPSWVSINGTTGVLSINTPNAPTESSTTNYSFTVTATNGVGSPAAQTFTVSVLYGAPTITSANNTSIYASQSGTFQVVAQAGPPISAYSLSGAPSWASINSSTGLITLTNAAAVSTTTAVSFTVKVTNSVGTTPQTFTVTELPTISYTSTTNAAITQNFSSLPVATEAVTSGTGTPVGGPYDLTTSSTGAFGASGLTGWYGANLVSGAEKFGEGEPTTTTGALFDFNDGNAGSQALGTISTTGTDSRFGALLVNNTGGTLNQFTVSYTGEEWWDNTGSGTTLNFSYEFGSQGLPLGTSGYTGVASLTFTAPDSTQTGVAVDGSTSAFQQTGITGTVTGITWAPGQTLAIFWDKGTSGAGTSDGLGIANVSFSAQLSATAPAQITSAPSAYATVGNSSTYQLAATGTPAATWALGGTSPNTPPSWVSVNSSTGLLTFTTPPALPTNGADAAFTFTVTATNGIGAPATQTFTVIETNPATSFTPGNLLLLQTGNNNAGTPVYSAEAPVSLQEITTSGTPVQNVPIPDNATVGGSGNQPLSLDLGTQVKGGTGANGSGDGQLERSGDSSVVSFDGNDDQLGATDFSSSNRVIGVVGVNPVTSTDTTTYGPFNSGDDSRGAVEANAGTIYNFGHTSNGGLRYFPGTGNSPTTGTEVDTSTTGNNIRDAIVGFNGQLYYSSAKVTGTGTTAAGILISETSSGVPVYQPTTPGVDKEVIVDPDGSGDLNGMFLADMNGDGILDTGDRMYFLDGTTGLYVSTYTSATGTNPYGTWSTATAVTGGTPTPVSGAANYLGITGQVVNSSTVQLYFTSADGAGNSTVWSLTDTGSPIQTASVIASTTSGSAGGMQYNGIAFAPIAATTISETINGSTATVDTNPGLTVTFVATVSSANGSVVGGTVYFDDANSGAPLGSAVIASNGTATFTTSALNAGQYSVYAYYAGSSTIAAASTGQQQLSITGSTTSATALSSTPNSSTIGATVTLTATVTTGATGTVNFFDGTTLVGTATLNGGTPNKAILTVSTFSIGTHSLTATFNGDNTYAPSTSSPADSQIVNAGATITVNDGSANAYGVTAAGTSVTFTAVVTGNGLSGNPNGSPSGTVQFYENGTAVGSPVALSGSGNVDIADESITIGQHGNQTGDINGSQLITAVYLPGTSSQYATVTTGVPWIETAQQDFAHNDLIVLDRQNQPSNASQLVSLVEYTPTGTLVQSVFLPDQSAGSTNTFGLSGHASTEGALALSGNESFLSAFGFDLPLGTVGATNSNQAVVPRTVASIGIGTAVNTATAVTVPDQSALQNARGAVTLDGNEYWVVGDDVAGSGDGIRYISPAGMTTNTSVPVGPVGGTQGYGIELTGVPQGYANIFVSTQQSGTGQSPIDLLGTHYNGPQNGANTPLPTTQSGLTPLPGLLVGYEQVLNYKNNPAPYGFLLFNHLTGTSVNPDTLYIADQNYGLLKFSNTTETDGDPTTGTWVITGQKLNNNAPLEGLTGYEANPGATGYSFVLYATAALSTGNPGNQLLSFTDTNAYNQGFNGTFTVLANAVNPTDTYSGLALAPLDLTTTTASATAITYGAHESTTLSATVVDTNNTDSPTGTVTFYVNGVSVGTGTLSTNSGTSETASLSYSPSTPLPVGIFTVTASYGGDVNDGTSTSPNFAGNVDYAAGDVIVTTVGTDATVGSIASITESGTTATVTTSAANTLVSGQTVTLSGVTPNGYNSVGTSTYTVTVTSSTTFTITATAGLGTATANQGTVYLGLNGNAATTTLEDFTGSTLNSANTVALTATGSTATISGIAESGTTATVTTTTAHNFIVGQAVTIAGSSVAGYDAAYTIATVPSTTTFTVTATASLGSATGGTATGTNNLTEVGTTTGAGYLADSLDNHSLSLAGYNQIANGSTTSANRDIGVIGPDGSVNLATQLAPSIGSISAAISSDGQGFWVDSGANIRYVSFGGTTPSAISAASWASSNGGTATITAPNSYISGQAVVVAGIGTATGYNGTFTVLSATSTQFTYYLATQPTGTATFATATSQLLPTSLTTELTGSNAIDIGTSAAGPQLYVTAGIQFQNNGVPSIDGPALVGMGLPESGGQKLTVLGTGTGQNFPSSTDFFGNFPSSNQIAISPDGQTIFVADSRTDGLGGILEYFQAVPGSWVLLGRLQVDNYAISSASESGATVTITTSAATDYFVGESVTVEGLVNTAYDGTFTVTGVSSGGFTYTDSFTGLPSSTPGVHGASATSADGGFRSLVANFNGSSPVLYATTSAVSGNRLLEITGGTTDGSAANLAFSVLATAAPNSAFRGVALAPTVAGTTASTTSLSVSPTSSDFASGVTLTATVTSGATGWVSFETTIDGVETEIGAAQVNSGGTATLNAGGDLAPGSYSIIAIYTGDSTYAASTSSAKTATIAKTSTSTTLTFSPSTVGTNQSDTLTAIVNVPAGVAPTGTVTFTNTTSSTTLGTAPVSQFILNVNGVPTVAFEASLVVAAGTFSSGSYNISAAYSGDGYFSSSTGSGTLSVVNSTTTTVTSNLADPTASNGQALTLTATVTSTGSGTAGGTVQFYDDTLVLGAPVTLNGSGVATETVNTSLVQSVTVTSASESTDGGGNTTVTIATDASNPMTVGESVVVEGINTTDYDGTFTVTAVSGNTFSYADNMAGGDPTDSGGGLAIGLNVLTPGLHSISAVYTPTGSSLTSFANSTGVLEQSVQAASFGASDVFQERNGDGITPLNTRAPNPVSGSIGVTIYIDELTPSGTLVQSLALPTADSQAFSISAASESSTTVTITTASPNNFAAGQLVTIAGITGTNTSGYNGTFSIAGVSGNTFTYTAVSGLGTATVTGATATGTVHAVVGDGQQSTTGQMTLSGDGQDLFLTGYDNNPLPFGIALPVPTGTGSASVPRAIAQISYNGTVQTEAFSTSMSLNTSSSAIFDGVYSPDGNQFYISGYNGVYYFPSVTQSASLQGSNAANQIVNSATTVIGLESFGGNLYAIGGGSTTAASTRIQQVGVGLPIADEATVTNASWASGVATITASNNFTAGQSVAVAGISTATGYNGTFTVVSASSTQFTYALATQPTGTPGFAAATASVQAVVTQVPGIPVNTSTQAVPVFFPVDAYLTHLGSTGTALDTIYIADDGKSFGAGAITKWSLVNDNISSITESGTTATVTLSAATLGLVAGESVNIIIAGETPTAYNGTFSVTVVSPTSFTFTAPASTGSDTAHGTASGFVENGAISYSDTVQQLGFYWLAGSTNPSTGAVTLYSTYGNGGNADFGPGITYSVVDSNGYNNAPGVPITAASWVSTNGGTVTITAANTFQAGQYVTITGITPTGYNGLYTILTANSSSFTYALSSNPGTASVSGSYAVSLNTVNTVAFEGVGGGYAGNETTRGVALAPQAMTTVLVDNGPNASTTAQAISLTVTVTSPGSINLPTGTVTLADASNGNATVATGTLSNGTYTFNVAAGALTAGTHNLVVVYGGDSYHQSQTSNTQAQVVNAVNNIAVSSVVTDAETAPIVSLSVSGTTVTVTTAGNTTFAAGEALLIANSGVAADNGSFTVASGSSNSDTFTYTDNNSGAANASSGGTATAVGGTGSLGTGAVGSSQRSMVDTIVYTFNQAVTLGSGAFTLAVHSSEPGTLPGSVNYASPDGGITWVVTFSGANVTGNSIDDGIYDITLNASAITANTGSGTLASSRTDTFFRLFDDVNGDGTVAGRPDFNAMQAALGTSTGQSGYVAYLDFNADGTIGGRPDFSAAQSRLGTSYSFSGFSITI